MVSISDVISYDKYNTERNTTLQDLTIWIVQWLYMFHNWWLVNSMDKWYKHSTCIGTDIQTDKLNT